MNIGDVFLALRADGARFQAEAVKEAQKAGDAAGATLGSRMGKAASVAFRGGLAVFSAGAAIATKGLIELDNTMAQFTADTGLAGEAADGAKKSILAMSGRNLQPMKEIGAVLGKVHTDLGLTGEAADETAERFLKFGLVTKRDAAEEVAAFDDILDAWGLTADKSDGLMDQLIASHQKFGGSIADDEEALKNLAPAMKALNFGIDDSIGLLNLFKTKGLDAATSQRAFNTAVKNLPPGTNLNDVIEKISAIEDPAQRAAAAIEIFGSKGGVALANALGPGIGSIDDFTLSTGETTGALDGAVSAIESTFGARTTLLLKGFTSQLITLGSSFGPVVTGLASLGTLAGSLGFKTLGAKLSAGIAGAWKAVASSALVSGAIGKASSLAATAYLKALIFGDAVGNAISVAWGKAGPIATKAAGGVGKALGTTAGKAFSVAFAAATVFMFLDELEKQKSQLAAQAEEFWTPINEQIATGATAGLEQSRGAINAAIEDITHDLQKMAVSGPALEILRAQLAAIDAALVSQAESWGAAFRASEHAGLGMATTADQLATAVDPAIKAFTDLGYSADQARELVGSDAKVLGDKVEGAFDVMVPSITDGAEAWQKYRDDVAAAQEKAITDQLDFTSKALSDLQGFQSGVETALSGVYSAENDATITKNRIIILEAQLTASRKEQQEKGAKITKAERADYQNNRIAIEGELDQLRLHSALIGDDMHRVTALNALLTAKDLKTNLLSENDNIRTAAQVQRDKIIGYLQDLATQGGPAAANAAKIVAQWLNPANPLSPLAAVDEHGKTLGTDFAGGIPLAQPAVNRSVNTLLGEVRDKFTSIPGTKWGKNLGTEFADGLDSRASYLNAATASYLLGMKERLAANSPPGPKSPLHKIDVWGERTADAYADPLLARLKALVERARGHIADLGTSLSRPMGMGAITAPRMPAIAVAGAGALGRPAIPYLSPEGFGGPVGGPGGSVTNVNVTVPGLLRAETPADVVRTLRHLNVYGTFGEPRDKG